MKQIYTFMFFSIFFFSCKKEVDQPNTDNILQNAKTFLKDSLRASDYSSLDFSQSVFNRVDSAGLCFLRVPFKGKSISRDFVIIRFDKDKIPKEGKIIQLDGGVREFGSGTVKSREWEGSISISSLNRLAVIKSDVHDGYIDAFHKQTNLRESVLQPGDLPEVIVVAYVHNYDTSDFSTWLWLNSFFYINNYDVTGDSGGYGGNYYGSLGSYGGTGDYAGGTGTGVTNAETILIDVDAYVDHPAIDVEQYLKCFDNIPDFGAICEVGIYSDIPVDSDPNKIFDFSTGSPGHTFIQIKKVSADGTKSIVQNIGFYPKTGWKTGLTNAPVEAKFVDDGAHEYNAAFTKNLTPDEFKSTLTEIQYLKNMQYDIDNYNCTDWALAVFNKQGYGLDIPLYDIPGNLPSNGTSMPQGIYNKLREMKKNNDAHSDKIQIGFYKGYVTYSNGPCN